MLPKKAKERIRRRVRVEAQARRLFVKQLERCREVLKCVSCQGVPEANDGSRAG